ncbi:MAG TPA: glycerol kinase GlpK [Chloroflexota bacterium]
MVATADFILALDQGTSGSAALVFDRAAQRVGTADCEISLSYPQPGWVEASPEDIFAATVQMAEEALQLAGLDWPDVAAIGIANQRETTVVWERASGRPVGPAIIWQCRRTAELCAALRAAGHEELVRRRTGLTIDPYFSATKIRWLLDRTPDGQRKAEAGELLFGTVDTWLIWRLTGGRVHATDFTNASRTMLFDIHQGTWSPELLAMLDIPAAMLPEVRASSGPFGETDRGTPILGVAGDQQAALFGQTCFAPGQCKSTYGTGAFLLMNTGARPISSPAGLLTTLAAAPDTFALEGAVFTAGAAVQWLRDGLGIIARAEDTEALALSVLDTAGVVFVPAFVGLGSPHWDPTARGVIVGLTGGARREHLVRATLEAIGFQVADLVEAMKRDSGFAVDSLRADGGASANAFLMQFQADILDLPVECPAIQETTALGAAYLAGLASGIWPSSDVLTGLQPQALRYEPSMPVSRRDDLLATWRRAVDRAKAWAG